MNDLEKYGIAQRDCVPSTWFSTVLERDPEKDKNWLDTATQEANAKCTATRRLVEEVREEYGLFRRYRCTVDGQDVEVSFSAATNDRDGSFSWCEYAYGGDQGLAEDKRYTEFRSR